MYTVSNTCEICGNKMFSIHCKLRCNECGNLLDCSDL